MERTPNIEPVEGGVVAQDVEPVLLSEGLDLDTTEGQDELLRRAVEAESGKLRLTPEHLERLRGKGRA